MKVAIWVASLASDNSYHSHYTNIDDVPDEIMDNEEVYRLRHFEIELEWNVYPNQSKPNNPFLAVLGIKWM